MLSPQVCLTLLLPAALETRLIDWLLSHDDGGIEFSVHRVAARGPLVRLTESDERVHGFATRVEFKLLVRREQLEPLLNGVLPLMHGVDGGYWVLPVETFEHFAPAEAAHGPGEHRATEALA